MASKAVRRTWPAILALIVLLVQGALPSTFARRVRVNKLAACSHSATSAAPASSPGNASAPGPAEVNLPDWQNSLQVAMSLVGDGRANSTLIREAAPGPASAPGSNAEQADLADSPKETFGAVKSFAAPRSVSVRVSINQGRYNISSHIYGVNEYQNPGASSLKEAGIRLMRRGGNAESRYNWAVDSANHGADWFFESLPNSNPGDPSTVDTMVSNNKANGIATVITIPIMNWLPRKQEAGCSFSVQKYGHQKNEAPDHPDCGNGVLTNGEKIKNDPSDVSTWTNEQHQKAWVSHLYQTFGSAKKGGVRYYCMDNEPVWWSYNHWDIHPQPSSYDEIVKKSLAFAPAIKAADRNAKILGPVTGGWSDTFFSLTDMQAGWSTYPWKYWDNPVDRRAHDNKPFIQYYLEQMKAYQQQTGRKILDLFDFHAYVVPVNDNTDPTSQAQRIEGVRVLWDPNYTCGFCDWVDPVTAPDGVPKFITRVKDIIASTYPGIGMAITEYNFGGTTDISGAIAQAEALAIFGKLGVDVASVFPAPSPSGTVYMAFKMFGNFDGKRGRFGNVGVQAISSDSQLSAYAAVDTKKNKLTILINNLSPSDADVTVTLEDYKPTRKISAYRYSAANLQQIVGLPSIKPKQSITMTYPGYSITMVVVPLFSR